MAPLPAAWCGTLAPGGWTFAASPDQPLLQSAELAGMVWPSSCRNGTCRTCICRLAQGRVAYRIAWPGLSAEEKAEGWILPCVALPLSDVVVEQPGARRNSAPQPIDTGT